MIELNNHIFNSHMVLPANKPLRLFGWGRGTVEIDFCGQHRKETFAEGNEWCIELDPMDYGGPYEMTVMLDDRKMHFVDIYLGEVYLFSGQSNMEFKLKETNTPLSECPANPMVRLFSTQALLDHDHFHPQDKWQVCAEETKGEWSALAYFVCNEIAQKKGIAVGAVACYLGASTIEAWLPRGLTRELGLYVPLIDRCDCNIWGAWNRGGGILYDFAFLQQVVPFPFSGVAWYQGESNSSVAEGKVYDRLLCTLIDRWRADLCDEKLPFVVVQIADYDRAADQAGWRLVQESQARVPSMREAVITVPCRDICETDDIHPKSKKELGHRIAQAFLELA